MNRLVQTMRAAVYRRYGGPEVVMVEQVPKPVPKDDEVLVRIVATTVSTADWHARSLVLPSGFGLFGRPIFGFFSPRKQILGCEASGVVEAVGKRVTKFQVGDCVIGVTGGKYGTHAEFNTWPEKGFIWHKPENLSFETAASIPFGGLTALYFFEKAHTTKTDKVLIVGAAGCCGSAAVQLAAAHYGAEVTAVCSGANADFVRSLGASHVIDYTMEDFTKDTTRQYDVIMDTTATVTPKQCAAVLNKGGRLLVVNGSLALFVGLQRFWSGGRKVIAGVATEDMPLLQLATDLAARGVWTPVIGQILPLEKIQAAHAYVDSGHKRGSMVITVCDAPVTVPVTAVTQPQSDEAGSAPAVKQ
eukprot:TRINITY_DN2393_c0_g1_i1.p1 TRINITY_DN2393_c0_g1~~TRINITY_DN2393_c0_g1_i1.p1  ORF type:complete len:359 (-),score=83.65 TRINITY_DN2393_c0_g1_i1:28-1104(-)